MRLFSAFDPPEAVVAELARAQDRLRAALGARRWQRMDQAHLTVHFFGEVPESRLAALEGAYERVCAAQPAFELELAGLGAFPSLRKPRLLWAGVKDLETQLFVFERKAHDALVAAGVGLEERKYSPHLTLARDPQPGGQVPGVALKPLRWMADELVLYRSTLTPQGPIYDVVRRFPLGGA